MSGIIDTARAAGNFQTLVRALQAAGLVEILSGPGPFTVFAPTDEAFSKLPPDTMENLLKDASKLKALLTYHVLPGKLMAADVAKTPWVKTVQGQALRIDTTRGVRVNNAMMMQRDIEATNGVIHVIDRVILPT